METPRQPGMSHQPSVERLTTPIPGAPETRPVMDGASPADMSTSDTTEQPKQQMILDKAKQMGRSVLDASTKAYHVMSEKVHDYRAKEKAMDTPTKKRYVAGAAAGGLTLASTIAMRKRGQSKPQQHSGAEKILEKAKELIPSR